MQYQLPMFTETGTQNIPSASSGHRNRSKPMRRPNQPPRRMSPFILWECSVCLTQQRSERDEAQTLPDGWQNVNGYVKCGTCCVYWKPAADVIETTRRVETLMDYAEFDIENAQ